MADYLLSFDPGTKNISYCLIHIPTCKIISWEIFSIDDPSYEGRCTKLANQLDELNPIGIEKNESEKNEVPKFNIIIEQQMGINTKTNRICGMLFMYFVKEKLLNNNIIKIVYYSAKHKIKYYTWEEGEEPLFKIKKGKKVEYYPTESLSKLKNGHYKTKRILIEHCRRILKQNKETEERTEYFEKCKKKDDLADSYVQGLCYIKYPSGVPKSKTSLGI